MQITKDGIINVGHRCEDYKLIFFDVNIIGDLRTERKVRNNPIHEKLLTDDDSVRVPEETVCFAVAKITQTYSLLPDEVVVGVYTLNDSKLILEYGDASILKVEPSIYMQV